MRFKAVFVGGGSYRTLPIVRAALADQQFSAASEIVLFDSNIGRAENVGRLIQKTPEFIRSENCHVSWTSDINRALPDCFHGLVSALSMHQTMLGDAIAAADPKLFAHALFAYPVNQNSKASKALWRELLYIHRNEINPVFQKAKDYF